MSLRSAFGRRTLALAVALTVPSVASAQTWDFLTEPLGYYAGQQVTITAGGFSALFSGSGLNMRGLGGSPFPAGSDRSLSTLFDSEMITMQLLNGVTVSDITFRNWLSGVYDSEVDEIIMTAYDGSGNFLGSITGTTEFMSLSYAGISKITWDDVGGTGYVIDEITVRGSVSEVPEPSTYVLMAGGLALVGMLARRRRA